MAAINDLISQIQDETLRNRIQEEVSKMAKQKKFGLVFEEHMPESTPLYDMPIKRGCNVMRRDSKDNKSIYVVLKVEGDTAVCVKPEQKDEAVTFELKDIVRVAEFGESIYPYLKPLDSVCKAPDSDLWHTLIEADNYHALQLLEYLYAGKVDCIYIDPPYNTGAKDWKYNNDYVDGILSAGDYIELKTRFDTAYQEQSSRLNQLSVELARLNRMLSDENKWLVNIRNIRKARKLTPEIAQAMIDHINVYKTGYAQHRLEIIFRFQEERDALEAAYHELEGGEAR